MAIMDVAQYILDKKGALSAWKLQKLCYYAQAWSLVWGDEPLFNDRIEAWADGPVVPKLYYLRRESSPAAKIPGGDSSRLSEEQRETIDAVLREYGDKSPRELITLTHQEAPWMDARQREGLMQGQPGNAEISLGKMAEFYGLYGTVDPDKGLEVATEFKEKLTRALNTQNSELLTTEQMRRKLNG